MGRRTVAECVKQESETLFGLFVGNVTDPEYPLLQFDIVDTNGTRSDLVAIQHKVVEVSLHTAGIRFQGIEILGLWHAEHMVGSLPVSALLVELEEREVDDPAECKCTGVGKIEVFRQFRTNRTERVARLLPGVGDKEDHISLVCLCPLHKGGFLALEELRYTTFECSVRSDFYPGKTFRSIYLRSIFECSDILS